MKGCSVLITKNEFAVLAALEREPGTSQRAIAARKAMSLGSVNAAYKALVDKGLVVDGALSDAGFEALAPFKVDNAIILAAACRRGSLLFPTRSPKVCCMFVERF